MSEPNPDQVTRKPREDGAVDTLRGPGSPSTSPVSPSSRPLGIETFTIPPAALEAAEKREGEGVDWADTSVSEGGMVEAEPPRSYRNEDDGVDEARRQGFLSRAPLLRRRYTLLLLLIMVFGILLIVAAAVSRSVQTTRPSPEGAVDRVNRKADADRPPAQPRTKVAASPPAPSSALSPLPGAASAAVRPAPKSPPRPPKTREFLYEDGYRDATP